MARGVLGYILDRGAQAPFLNLSKAYFLGVNHLSSHSLKFYGILHYLFGSQICGK